MEKQQLPGEIQIIINAITAQRDQALAANVNMAVAQYHAEQRIKELEQRISELEEELSETREDAAAAKNTGD